MTEESNSEGDHQLPKLLTPDKSCPEMGRIFGCLACLETSLNMFDDMPEKSRKHVQQLLHIAYEAYNKFNLYYQVAHNLSKGRGLGDPSEN